MARGRIGVIVNNFNVSFITGRVCWLAMVCLCVCRFNTGVNVVDGVQSRVKSSDRAAAATRGGRAFTLRGREQSERQRRAEERVIRGLTEDILPRIHARTYYAHPRARVMSFSARDGSLCKTLDTP